MGRASARSEHPDSMSATPSRFSTGRRRWPRKSWRTEVPWGNMVDASTESASAGSRRRVVIPFRKRYRDSGSGRGDEVKLQACVRIQCLHRRKKTNEWTATTKQVSCIRASRRGGCRRIHDRKMGGEREGDEDHAIVTVFLECDQTMGDRHSLRYVGLRGQPSGPAARQFADVSTSSSSGCTIIWHEDHDEDGDRGEKCWPRHGPRAGISIAYRHLLPEERCPAPEADHRRWPP